MTNVILNWFYKDEVVDCTNYGSCVVVCIYSKDTKTSRTFTLSSSEYNYIVHLFHFYNACTPQ